MNAFSKLLIVGTTLSFCCLTTPALRADDVTEIQVIHDFDTLPGWGQWDNLARQIVPGVDGNCVVFDGNPFSNTHYVGGTGFSVAGPMQDFSDGNALEMWVRTENTNANTPAPRLTLFCRGKSTGTSHVLKTEFEVPQLDWVKIRIHRDQLNLYSPTYNAEQLWSDIRAITMNYNTSGHQSPAPPERLFIDRMALVQTPGPYRYTLPYEAGAKSFLSLLNTSSNGAFVRVRIRDANGQIAEYTPSSGGPWPYSNGLVLAPGSMVATEKILKQYAYFPESYINANIARPANIEIISSEPVVVAQSATANNGKMLGWGFACQEDATGAGTEFWAPLRGYTLYGCDIANASDEDAIVTSVFYKADGTVFQTKTQTIPARGASYHVFESEDENLNNEQRMIHVSSTQPVTVNVWSMPKVNGLKVFGMGMGVAPISSFAGKTYDFVVNGWDKGLFMVGNPENFPIQVRARLYSKAGVERTDKTVTVTIPARGSAFSKDPASNGGFGMGSLYELVSGGAPVHVHLEVIGSGKTVVSAKSIRDGNSTSDYTAWAYGLMSTERQAGKSFKFPMDQAPSGRAMVANPGNVAAHVTVEYQDEDGAVVGTESLTVPANGAAQLSHTSNVASNGLHKSIHVESDQNVVFQAGSYGVQNNRIWGWGFSVPPLD